MGTLGSTLTNALGGGVNANQTAAGIGLQTPFTGQQVTDQYGSANDALSQQRYLQQALGSTNGINNQNQAVQMAFNQANGIGPNPAQAMLAQQTQANTAYQAALMAGQRGAGANAGLIARQAAQQGGANQQQAVGQAATLGAQQQLAGQQQFANMANQQVNQMQQATGAYNASAQGLLGQTAGGVQGQNQNAMQLANMNNQNAQVNSANNIKLNSGLINGAASALGMPMAAGGEVPSINGTGARSSYALNMKSGGTVPGQAKVAGDSYANDTVPAMLSPGEVVIPRHIMQGSNPADAAKRFVAAVLAKKR